VLYHLLFLELLCDVARPATGDLDPCFGEEGADGNDEGYVNGGVDGVEDGFFEGMRWGHVVRDARGGKQLRRVLQGLQMVQVSAKYKWRELLTSQTPRILTKKLSGNRDESICETIKTLELSADSSMMGMLDV
jgi:hypothetical protein